MKRLNKAGYKELGKLLLDLCGCSEIRLLTSDIAKLEERASKGEPLELRFNGSWTADGNPGKVTLQDIHFDEI